MREIKFRAWKKSENRMLDWHELSQLYGTHLADALNRVWLEDVMQFTGLKDRNGVEIYESDIVNYHFVEDHLSCTVMWNEDRCCFGFKDKGDDVIYGVNVMDVAERAEVIGNIFQNKELLE